MGFLDMFKNLFGKKDAQSAPPSSPSETATAAETPQESAPTPDSTQGTPPTQ